MGVTTGKTTNMTHKHLPVWFVAAALLISFTTAALADAQVGTQQMPGSSNGSSSYGSSPAGAAGQTRSGASVGVDGPGLKMVPEDFAKLPLAPGFLVSLTVLDDPDLVGAFRVD